MTSLPPALGSSFVMRNNESHCSGLMGIFPALIANLAGKKSLKLIVEGIKKNRVQFRMLGGDYDTVTLISQSKYCNFHFTLNFSCVAL